MIYGAGDTLEGYKLLAKCGEGAFGSVFLAGNETTQQQFALKILYKHGRHHEHELKGLIAYQEKCRHANLMRIYHIGQNEDCIFYVMDAADNLNPNGEYLPDTLGNRLKQQKRLAPGQIRSMLNELLSGLEILHSAGLLHRDIKPDNILWVNGQAVLGDIGLVTANKSVSFAGTPGFISPDIWNGKRDFAPQDDLYALAMTLYCAFSGESPRKYPELSLSLTLGGGRDIIKMYNAVLAAGSSVRTVADWRSFLLCPPPEKSSGKKYCWIIAAVFLLTGIIFGIFFTWKDRSGTPDQPGRTALPPAARPAEKLVRQLTDEWQKTCEERLRKDRERKMYGESARPRVTTFSDYGMDTGSLMPQLEVRDEIEMERENLPVLKEFAEFLIKYFADVMDDSSPEMTAALRSRSGLSDEEVKEIDRLYSYALVNHYIYGIKKSGWFAKAEQDFEKTLVNATQEQKRLLRRRTFFLGIRSAYPPKKLLSTRAMQETIAKWHNKMPEYLPELDNTPPAKQ